MGSVLTVVGVLLKLGVECEQGEDLGVTGASSEAGDIDSGIRSSLLIRRGV